MAEIVEHRDSIGQDKPVIIDRHDNERALIRHRIDRSPFASTNLLSLLLCNGQPKFGGRALA
jgi:hypothetical protein